MMKKLGATMLAMAAVGAAQADEMTVQSLLNDGYTAIGAISTPAGPPGVFLQNGKALALCFVSERPGSAAVSTMYCKPVR